MYMSSSQMFHPEAKKTCFFGYWMGACFGCWMGRFKRWGNIGREGPAGDKKRNPERSNYAPKNRNRKKNTAMKHRNREQDPSL